MQLAFFTLPQGIVGFEPRMFLSDICFNSFITSPSFFSHGMLEERSQTSFAVTKSWPLNLEQVDSSGDSPGDSPELDTAASSLVLKVIANCSVTAG